MVIFTPSFIVPTTPPPPKKREQPAQLQSGYFESIPAFLLRSFRSTPPSFPGMSEFSELLRKSSLESQMLRKTTQITE